MNKPIRFSQPTSVRRRSLHEDVADHLRTMITEEALPEGLRIDEHALCQQLDISRTPLREALKVLQSERMVTIEPHKGARVALVTEEELTELFDVLSGLERLAAELAAARASDEALLALERMHNEMEAHYRASHPQAYFTLNQQIHQRVIDLAGNRQLQLVHSRLIGKTRRGRYLSTISQAHWDESVAEHRALLEALQARDGFQAGQILYQHVLKTGDTIRELMRQQKIERRLLEG